MMVWEYPSMLAICFTFFHFQLALRKYHIKRFGSSCRYYVVALYNRFASDWWQQWELPSWVIKIHSVPMRFVHQYFSFQSSHALAAKRAINKKKKHPKNINIRLKCLGKEKARNIADDVEIIFRVFCRLFPFFIYWRELSAYSKTETFSGSTVRRSWICNH